MIVLTKVMKSLKRKRARSRYVSFVMFQPVFHFSSRSNNCISQPSSTPAVSKTPEESSSEESSEADESSEEEEDDKPSKTPKKVIFSYPWVDQHILLA